MNTALWTQIHHWNVCFSEKINCKDFGKINASISYNNYINAFAYLIGEFIRYDHPYFFYFLSMTRHNIKYKHI